MINAKTGQLNTFAKLVLVVMVVGVLVFAYGRVTAGSNKVLLCSANGGTCTKGTCDFRTQIPALSDKAAGCQKDEICCIPVVDEDDIDPSCEGKKLGDVCSGGYCDASLKCINHCEFCSKNAKQFQSMCDVNGQKDIDNFYTKGTFTCGCTNEECILKEKDGTCIRNYCGSGSTYCCVK
ncbi:MAG TPA: hypothetical protein VEC16_01915 [Alphaproteobacteria bacterium]|nr:hypothetical protein [Alphaproteobacteria bacterium]